MPVPLAAAYLALAGIITFGFGFGFVRLGSLAADRSGRDVQGAVGVMEADAGLIAAAIFVVA